MRNTTNQATLPLRLVAINWVGGALILAGFAILQVAKPEASGSRWLCEILMGSGALCYVVYAVRWWQWRKDSRSRPTASGDVE